MKSVTRSVLALSLSTLPLLGGLASCGGDSGDTGETVVVPPESDRDRDGRPESEVPSLRLTFTEEQARAISAGYGKTVKPKFAFEFDKGLDANARLAVQSDLVDLAGKRFSTPKTRSFADAFGGTESSDALRYLGERIKVFLGADTKAAFLSSEASEARDERAFMTAANFGTLVWYESFVKKRPAAAFGADGKTYPVSSMRDGVISILPGYNTVSLPKRAGKEFRFRAAGTSTLIHEARHSDCSEALTSADVTRIEITDDLLQGNTKCGHLHVKCPTGHPLAGLNACDDHAWGAYTLSYVYSLMVATGCENCTEEEKIIASVSAIDSFDRVLPFPTRPQEDGKLTLPLLEGDGLPVPDMTHKESR